MDIPEGFVVEQTAAASPPPVPEGFVLETPQAAPAAPAPAIPEGFQVEQSPSLLDYPVEAAKGVVPGAVGTVVAAPLKGAAGLTTQLSQSSLDLMNRIDSGEKVLPKDDFLGYGALSPEQRQQFRQTNEATIGTPTAERTPFKAAQAVEQTMTDTFGQRPEGGLGVARDIGGVLGSVAGGIGVSMIPGVGPYVAAPMWTMAGSGEATQTAVKNKATEPQIGKSAVLGTGPGATDFADNLLIAFGGSTGKALGALRKFGEATLKSVLVEGGQEGFQQFLQNAIAKGIYKPDQDLMEDVPYNALLGAIGGGVVGGGLAAVGGKQDAATAPASQSTVEDAAAVLAGGTASPAAAAQASTFESPQPGPIFVSRLREAAEQKLPESGSAEQMLATLRNQPGVKEEEIAATGLEDFLAAQSGRVSKADVVAHLEDSQVQVQEVLRGQNEKPPSWEEVGTSVGFGEYTVPGPRANYRELLLTLPVETKTVVDIDRGFGTKQVPKPETTFSSPHWNEPNVLAHIRFTERPDSTGAKMLFVEEIQSDWHQQGRQQGYKGEPTSYKVSFLDSDGYRFWENFRTKAEADSYLKKLQDIGKEDPKVEAQYDPVMDKKPPNAPFKTSWPDLAFKRMLRWAADNGYQRVAWTTGDLAAQYAAGGTTDVKAVAGLNEFYGKIIPSIARKWAKRLGGTIGEAQIQSDIPLTPQQRPDGSWGITDPATGMPVGRWATRVEAEQDILLLQPTGGNLQGFTRVQYLEIPPRAATIVQKGLPLFSTFERPKLTVDPGALLSHPDAAKIGWIVQDMAAQFDIHVRLRIRIAQSLPTSARGNIAAGYLQPHAFDGSYDLLLNASAHRNAAQLYATAMHEFGHLVLFEKFTYLPIQAQQAVRSAYEKWRSETPTSQTQQELWNRRDNAVINHFNMRGQGAKPLYALSPEERAYWSSFDEWFAEQVARWATTADKPLNLAERTFKSLGLKLLEIFQKVSAKLGLDFRAEPAMAAWLDSFIDSAPPLGATVYPHVDLKTQQENARLVQQQDPDVIAVEQQHETLPTRDMLDKLFDGNVPRAVREMGAHADKMTWFQKWMVGLDRLVDLHPQFAPLLRYHERVNAMLVDASKVHDAAMRIEKAGRHLGVQMDRSFRVIDEMMNMTYRTDEEVKRGIARHPTKGEFAALVRKHKVNDEGVGWILQVRKIFDDFLTLLQQNAVADATRTITDPAALAAKLDAIQRQMTNFRASPYFPAMRFGKYFVTVKDAAGKTVHREHFERRGVVSAARRQDSAYKRLKEAYPGMDVEKGLLPDSVEPFVGVPPALLESIAREMKLTPLQQDALQQLQFQMSPAQSFRHRLQHKNYVPGYSDDFLRSFATYFFHGGRYYAKTKHAWALRQHIREAKAVGGNDAAKIANYMEDHLGKAVLDATSDSGIFKGAIFYWVFGFSVAGAGLNLTQVPMISYPFLAAKFGGIGFGDARASKAILRAYTKLKNFYKKGEYSNATDFEMRAFDYGIRTKRIDQSQAMELAGLSQGNNLLGMGGNKLSRGVLKFQEIAAWMFEATEKVNRRVTFAATLDLAQKYPNALGVTDAINKYNVEFRQIQSEGFTEAEARTVIAAIHATDQTQYNYAREVRPRFMRGKLAGTLLVFKNYLLNTLLLMGANKSDVMPRMLLLGVAMYGLMGLPGADDLNEIVKALGKWLFGKDFDVKRNLIEFVKQHTDGTIPPELILHGLARKGFGIPALVDLMGEHPSRGLAGHRPGQNVPAPVFDLSRSLGMGNVLPVNVGKLMAPDDQNRALAEQVQQGGGAVFGVGFNIYKAITDPDLQRSDPKRWERAMPRALQGASRAYRALTEGRERTRGGPASASTVVQYDVRDTEQMMEVIGLGLGYQDLRRTAKWEQVIAELEVKAFFDGQRKALLSQWFEATKGGNKAEIDRVKAATMDFNKGLPEWAKGKTLTGETIKKSIEGRQRSVTAREAGVPVQKTNRGIAQHMQELFPESTVDVRRVR